jgi:hypothetical protein
MPLVPRHLAPVRATKLCTFWQKSTANALLDSFAAAHALASKGDLPWAAGAMAAAVAHAACRSGALSDPRSAAVVSDFSLGECFSCSCYSGHRLRPEVSAGAGCDGLEMPLGGEELWST